jgi:exodeoxyribonuclease-3
VRVVSWNVNSLRVRYERLLGFLDRHDPDVVCLQETKAEDSAFPDLALKQRGYHVAFWGQKSYNGVAILSKAPLDAIEFSFPNNPVPAEARAIAATIQGLRIWDLYVVNGQALDSPKFQTKMAWLEALKARVVTDAAAGPTLLVGDWNITPDDRDVHDPEKWSGGIHASDEERSMLQSFFDAGFTDLQRLFDDGPGPWTWWDYRFQAFRQRWGIRIDLALGNPAVRAKTTAVAVDKDERRQTTHPSKPSDHAPVIVDLDWPFTPEPPAVPKATTVMSLGDF